MPSKTRKSKKQRFNRRKSRKIGGTQNRNSNLKKSLNNYESRNKATSSNHFKLSNREYTEINKKKANAVKNAQSESSQQKLFSIELPNVVQNNGYDHVPPPLPPPPVAKATALENNKVQQPPSASAPTVSENVVKSNTQQPAPTVSASDQSSTSVSTNSPVNANEALQNLQQSNDPLCQLKVGDLVEYVKSYRTKTLAYVKEIKGNIVTLSNNEPVEISKLQKYQYQDILLSLSRILQFVLENKDKPNEESESQNTHIQKINSIKQNLEAVQNKLTPQGNT